MVNLSFITFLILRYKAIVSQPGNRLRSVQARLLLAVTWLISSIMAIAPVLFFGRFKRSETSTNCKSSSKVYLLLVTVACFIIPLLIMTYCYLSIVYKVRMQRVQIQAWTASNPNMKMELKTAKIVFAVLATFVICWLPFVTVYMLSVSGYEKRMSSGLFLIAVCLSAAHSACNPIIYITMNKRFRHDLTETLRVFKNSITL